MYIVWDALTETLIGPFNSYEDAQMFVIYTGDITAELTIEPVSEPQEWALDNGFDGVLALTKDHRMGV